MASIGRERSAALAALVDGELRGGVLASLAANEPLGLKELAITATICSRPASRRERVGDVLGKLLDRVLVDPRSTRATSCSRWRSSSRERR